MTRYGERRKVRMKFKICVCSHCDFRSTAANNVYLPHSYSIKHGTDNKTGLRLCVSVSVRAHSHGRISWSIFTKIGTDVTTPKSKSEFVGGQHRITPSQFCPLVTVILGRGVLKIHANINNPISALNVRESPQLSRL